MGTPIDTSKIDKHIMGMSGTGQFLSLTYSMVERNNQQGLQIQTERKPYIPPLVRPLIFIDGSQYNNVLFTVGARITYTDFGTYRSELRNDVILGSNYALASEYYHPFTPATHWFIAPRAGLLSTQINLYSDQTLLATYRDRQAGGGADMDMPLSEVANCVWAMKAPMNGCHLSSGIRPYCPTFPAKPAISELNIG